MQRTGREHDRRFADQDVGERPVFLVGAPRSGTSLLYKALCMHPEAAWISNWVRRFPRALTLAALNRIPPRFPRLQRRVWFGSDSNAYVYGSRRRLWEQVFPMPVEGEPIFERSGLVDDSSGGIAGQNGVAEHRLGVLRSNLESIRRMAGGSVFINKRIGNNRRIGLLVAAFPYARFVDLVRDGRAVAYSLARVDWWPDSVPWWHDQTPKRWEAEGGDPWELCARSWVEEVGAIERGLEAVPSEQVLHLSYEQLIRSPLESLQTVRTFAGLSENRGWLDRVGGLQFPNRNETWRENLSRAEIATIEEIQRDTLIRYGYAV